MKCGLVVKYPCGSMLTVMPMRLGDFQDLLVASSHEIQGLGIGNPFPARSGPSVVSTRGQPVCAAHWIDFIT